MMNTTLQPHPPRAALIVGAGDATGSAIARRFAREDYIACVTRRSSDKLATLVAEIEAAGGQAESVAGFGLGRAFAPSMRAMAGLGRVAADPTMLFGVGTPDMSASRMFNGATVAVEEGGPMSGASVSIETPSAFAGALQ